MKVALYARVSKADESQDPENQLVRLRESTTQHNWEVDDEYVDRASGADPNRPELARMLNAVRGNQVKAIVVTKVDRIARSTIDMAKIVELLVGKKAELICIDQPEVSTNKTMGKVLLGILSVVAELERDLISDRTKDGLARARAAGKRLGRPQKRIDMARVHELQAQGLGCRKIAEELGISRQTLWSRLKNEGVNSEKESSSVPPG